MAAAIKPNRGGRKAKNEQENIVDSTTETSTEQVIVSKVDAKLPKRQTKKTAALLLSNETVPVPQRAKRKAASDKVYADVDDEENIEDVKPKRGRKKASPKPDGVKEKAEAAVPEVAKKGGRAKKADTGKKAKEKVVEVVNEDEPNKLENEEINEPKVVIAKKAAPIRRKRETADQEHPPNIDNDDVIKELEVDDTKPVPNKRKLQPVIEKSEDIEMIETEGPKVSKKSKPASGKKEIEEKPVIAKGKGKGKTNKKVDPKEGDVDDEVAKVKAVNKRKGKGKIDKKVEEKNDVLKLEDEDEIKTKPVKTPPKKRGKAESNGKQNSKKEEEEEMVEHFIEKPKGRKKAAATTKVVDEEEIVAELQAAPKAGRSGKRKAPEGVEELTKKTASKKPLLNDATNNFSSENFSVDKEFNLKISSWNVAGLRACVTKGGLHFADYEKPDILCLQETKCAPDNIPEEAKLKGYHPYWHPKTGGLNGVAIYSKIMPYNVDYNIGDAEMDEDARIITAEYEKFYLICVYVPNSSRKLVNLDKRMRWNKVFESYITKLDAKKPVIICGDMNVSHLEIDLANPKTNKRNAGFTQEERDGMSNMLALGFVDTFRHLYPDQEKAYTFWTYMANARKKNVGWRLDYFIVSQRLVGKVVDNIIRSDVLGSDHCPITLLLNNV